MKTNHALALLGASLLSACGGGGGADDTASPAVTPSTTATVALSGTAAKGLMANADIFVYAINPDGTVDSSRSLAGPTVTDAEGRYSLSFAGTKDQPYVVQVKAKADGSTTHRDEVSGTAQLLPASFSMRSLVTPAATGNVTTRASITPFSEMAVAAAARASGGVNATNAAQAVSTVQQLLGFDPTQVAATTTTAAASDDEKKLAVMLTAVSQMATSGDLGCATGDAGDKVKCVVEALGAATSTTSIKLEKSGGGGDDRNVSAVLNTAVNTVLAKPELVGTIPSSLLTTVATNLACSTSCAAASTGTTAPVDATATAIAGAKLLFTQLKSDWTALFSRGGASDIANGAANVQAFKFDSAMRGVHLPLRTLLTDSGAVLMGVDLYNDYKAGRTGSTSRGRGFDMVATDGSVAAANFAAAGCSLYQDAGTQTLATEPGNANFIGCSARYHVSRSLTDSGFVTNEYRHGFTLTPQGDGRFGWQTRARLRQTQQNGTVLANQALQTDAAGTALTPFTGTLTTTLTGTRITAFTLVGDLAGGFGEDTTALVNHQHRINLSGTRTASATDPFDTRTSISGSLVALDSAANTLSTLTVKDSSLSTQAISRDANFNAVAPGASTAVAGWGGDVSAGTLNLVFTTANAEFEGLFSVPGSAWDKSGTRLDPTEATLAGMLRTLDGGTVTEFFSGRLTAKTSGFANWDAQLPFSDSNRYGRSLSFVGKITAPNRPLLELSLGAEQRMDSADGSTESMTLQYRSIVNGTPRLVVTVNGSREAGSDTINRFTLTEASAKLSLSWLDGASTVELKHADSRVIGSVNAGSGVVTFSDGSLVSLDVGL